MTKCRYVGQLARHTALRKRQQGFLTVLADCSGSRVRAVEKSGIPLGTVLRWQSDEWFRERYSEVREALARDEEALRDTLTETAIRMALGRYTGLLKPAGVRRILDGRDEQRTPKEEQPAESLTRAELDARIQALLRPGDAD